MNKGYIYVLLNRALQKDHYKIGKTTKDPVIRAQELSSATGVPQPFEVIYHELVADCDRAERLVHDKLAQYRISEKKNSSR